MQIRGRSVFKRRGVRLRTERMAADGPSGKCLPRARHGLGQGSEAGEGLAPWGLWWQGLAAVQASVGTQWWIRSEKPEPNLEG